MRKIGIKLADGSFYPIMEDKTVSNKNLVLTTVKDNQTRVIVDVYRTNTDSMEDAEYIDSLQIDNLVEHPHGSADISLNISLDENRELSASINDPETGATSTATVTLVSRTLEERLEPTNYNVVLNKDGSLTNIDEEESKKDNTAAKVATVAVAGAVGGGLLARMMRENGETPKDEETVTDESSLNTDEMNAMNEVEPEVADESSLSVDEMNTVNEPEVADESSLSVDEMNTVDEITTDETEPEVVDEVVSDAPSDIVGVTEPMNDDFALPDFSETETANDEMPTDEMTTEASDEGMADDEVVLHSDELPMIDENETTDENIDDVESELPEEIDVPKDADETEPEIANEIVSDAPSDTVENAELTDDDFALPDFDDDVTSEAVSSDEMPDETTAEATDETDSSATVATAAVAGAVGGGLLASALSNKDDEVATETEVESEVADESSLSGDEMNTVDEPEVANEIVSDAPSDTVEGTELTDDDFALPDFDDDVTSEEIASDEMADENSNATISSETSTDDSFDLPETTGDDDFNLPDDNLSETTTTDPTPSNGINFDGLYDDETVGSDENQDVEETVKKKTRVPVIICITCAIICVIATLLVLFVVPSKYNLLSKKAKVDEPIVETLEPKTAETEEIEELEPEMTEEPIEAKEEDIVVVTEPEVLETVVPVPPEKPVETPKDITYKIKWGDTLWDISDAYYKNPWKYKKIAKYNHIKNPDHIISGTTIEIPAE